MSQESAERPWDDLDAVRQRVRELIDEERDLFDALDQ